MSSSAIVTSADRLTFTGFLAALLHAALILGISFTATDPNPTSHTLEVTLASYKSEQAPEKADFLAQENQQGSGTLDDAKMLTTDVDADFDANSIQQTSPLEQQASAPQIKPEQATLVASNNESRFKTQLKPKPAAVDLLDLPNGPKKSLLERSLEMASLEAKLDTMRQIYAKAPRIQRLTAASTLKANDAYYVNSWRRKIEKMGTLNYPREAESCYTNCSLRLLVSINPDGTINNLRILESSGKQVLDDAAIRIVRRSAPFAPFTEEMKRDIDLLEIIRTWQFKGNRYMTEVN
ncbi:MAG: protein TonB [Oleispira sp.]|jgi:protein TonB